MPENIPQGEENIAQSGKEADNNQSVSDHKIATVEFLIKPKEEAQLTQNQNDNIQKRLTRWTRVMSIATVLLFIATSFMAWLSWRQIAILSEQTSAITHQSIVADSQWNVSKNQLGISRETMKRQLRAYVSLIPRGLVINDPRPFLTFSIANNGQTPAYNVKSWADYFFGNFPLNDTSIFSKKGEYIKGEPKSKTLLNPQQIIEFSYDTVHGNQHELADFENKKKALYIYGRIEYDDVFGEHHWSKFCLMCAKWIDEGRSITPCDFGNEAN